MYREVNLDIKLAFSLLENNSNAALSEKLRVAFPRDNCEDPRLLQFTFSEDVLHLFRQILKKFLSRSDLAADEEELLSVLLKSYRNYVIDTSVQNFLSSDDDFLKEVHSLLKHQQDSDLRMIIMQFLCNMIYENKPVAARIFGVFFEDIMEALRNRCCLRFSSAALYNFVSLQNLSLTWENYELLIELFEEEKNIDSLKDLIQKCVESEHFWEYFLSYKKTHRVSILDLLSDMYSKNIDPEIPNLALDSLVNCFIKCDHTSFQGSLESNETRLKALETALLLDVISCSSARDSYLKVLQTRKDLMIHCGAFLINIHRLGKTRGNCFTPILNLRQQEEEEGGDSFLSHPILGFKARLIRVIGNLSYQCKTMQDLCRNGELIPIILECSVLDAKNPFIQQWSILAIRNLCENNIENQKIIAEVRKQEE